MRAHEERADSLVHLERMSAREGATAAVAMAPEVSLRLKKLGITGLWTHQAEALAHARAGRNVAVATGTASGKSLVYQLALAERLAATRGATALLLFPTWARA